MSINRISRFWRAPLLASGLTLLVLVTVFSYQQITPFGDHNFLISDMGTQYLSFFTSYRHALIYHNFQFYSFSQSLGGSLVPTVAYYLMSPFNLIVLGFSAADLPIAITIILMSKITAIGFTMTYWLQRHFHTTQIMTALLGTAFALCGFVAMNYFDLMWLDALIWLPLIIDGLDRLLNDGQAGRFFWWLWVSIVTDFYLGYMTILFIGYYLIYQLFETKQTNWRDDLRQRWPRLREIILTGLLSVVSALFILIPTALGLMQTAKSSHAWQIFLPVPQFGTDIFSQLALGANTYQNRLTHAPTIFSTTAVILLVGAFFTLPSIKRTTKVHTAWFLGALLLSMGIELFNTIWHLFQQPEGFPFRNAFFFSFALIMIAMQAWQAGPQHVTPAWRWRLTLGLSGLLLIGWVTNWLLQFKIPVTTLMLSLVSVALTALVLWTTKRWWQTSGLAVIMLSELGGNFSLSMANTSFGSQAMYQQAYSSEYTQMTAVNDPDGQLYRVDNTNTLINRAYQEKYNNYNDPMLFNFHDINYYSSTLNEKTRVMLDQLGLYSRNARRISSEGLTPVSSMLLGIKYDVLLNRHGDATTIPNHHYLGMGFAVPSEVTQLQLSATRALANQEKILQLLRPQATPYFHDVALTTATSRRTQSSDYSYHHRLIFKTTATGPLYFDDYLGLSQYSSITVNGQSVTPTVNADDSRLLWHLGNFKRGATVRVTFNSAHRQLSGQVRLASLQMSQFNQVYRYLKTSQFVPKYHARGWQTIVSGTMQNQQARHWLYVAIPYDQAWHATVNGETVKTKAALGNLTAVPIKPGHNQIKLQYHVPALLFSTILSIIGALSFVIWRLLSRRRH
ncbi:YfhO family protein [Lactiplantibacillus fabifermentans]|nr:YfhO family protein [Lactiplantibacillus fabifermentans]